MPISAVSSLIALGFQQNILKASEGREEADVGWQWPSRGAGTARDIVEQVVGRDFTAALEGAEVLPPPLGNLLRTATKGTVGFSKGREGVGHSGFLTLMP